VADDPGYRKVARSRGTNALFGVHSMCQIGNPFACQSFTIDHYRRLWSPFSLDRLMHAVEGVRN
jgi:hypothetical protein